jgi:uncharacterized protein (TIGR03083 family)
MQISPRYGAQPVLRIETTLGDLATPVIRQRQRLAATLASLDDEQWAAPSRCEGWSTQDVIAHLIGTNQFWAISITSGLSGAPTRFLAEFDPVATPAQMVAAVRSRTAADTLEQFVATNDDLSSALASVGADQWTVLAEAPPGHVAIRALALHALWDSWIHERDILVPLGVDVVEEPDEVIAGLQYAAALGPAFHASTGVERVGRLRVRATDPDTTFDVFVAGSSVEVRDAHGPSDGAVLEGRATELLEALSFREDRDHGLTPDDQWLVTGLDEVFEVAG